METKEFKFNGWVVNGFVMLFLNLILTIGSIVAMIYGIVLLAEETNEVLGGWLLGCGSLLLLASIIVWTYTAGAQRGKGVYMVRKVQWHVL